jgi:hypothetical protein
MYIDKSAHHRNTLKDHHALIRAKDERERERVSKLKNKIKVLEMSFYTRSSISLQEIIAPI